MININYTNYLRHEKKEYPKEAIIGDMKYSARTDDIKGWFICDGRSLDRTTYHHLFNVIGVTYGSSSDTTFNIPDCRGRILGAIGNGDNLTNRSIGEMIGEENHTMVLSELVSHTHTGITALSGNHQHTGTSNNGGDHNHTGTTNTAGDHTHAHNAPGGQGGLGLAIADGSNTTIDTDTSLGELNVWTTARGLNISNNGSHSHTVTTSSSGPHTHTFTSEVSGLHSHIFTSNETGGGTPFNVMQPTIFIGNVFIYYGSHCE